MADLPGKLKGDGSVLEKQLDDLKTNLQNFNITVQEHNQETSKKITELENEYLEARTKMEEFKQSVLSEKQIAEQMTKLKNRLEKEKTELEALVLRETQKARNMEKIKDELEKELKNEKEERKKDVADEARLKAAITGCTVKEQFTANTITVMQNYNDNQKEMQKLEGKLEGTTEIMRDMIGKFKDEIQVDLKKIFEKLTGTNEKRQELRSRTDDHLPKLMEDLKATEKIEPEKERTDVQDRLCKKIHAITDNLFKNIEANQERRDELDRIWDEAANELELKLNELPQDSLKEELINQLKKMRDTVEQLREHDEKNAENLRMLEILLQQKEAELARLKAKLLEDLNKFQVTPKEQVFAKLSLIKVQKEWLKIQLSAKETDCRKKKEKIVHLRNDIKKKNAEILGLQSQSKKHLWAKKDEKIKQLEEILEERNREIEQLKKDWKKEIDGEKLLRAKVDKDLMEAKSLNQRMEGMHKESERVLQQKNGDLEKLEKEKNEEKNYRVTVDMELEEVKSQNQKLLKKQHDMEKLILENWKMNDELENLKKEFKNKESKNDAQSTGQNTTGSPTGLIHRRKSYFENLSSPNEK